MPNQLHVLIDFGISAKSMDTIVSDTSLRWPGGTHNKSAYFPPVTFWEHLQWHEMFTQSVLKAASGG